MMLKCCTQCVSKYGKLSSSNPKEGNTKEFSNYRAVALILHTSKVVLKILETRLQQCANQELPDVQAGFRKGRGIRDQFAKVCWIIKIAREFQKNIYFCFIDYAKAFDCVAHKNCGKFLKRWKYQSTLSASCETCMQFKKQQLGSDMEQQIGSKLRKKYVKAVYCHPSYLTSMQSTSCKMPGG